MRKRKPAPPAPGPLDPPRGEVRRTFTRTLMGSPCFQVAVDFHRLGDYPICVLECENSPLATASARRRVREEIVDFFAGSAQVLEKADAEGRTWWRTWGSPHQGQMRVFTDTLSSDEVKQYLGVE